MSHRAHLFSLRIGHALRESCFAEPYTGSRFRKDLPAGLTVGIIAVPLAMALAIASGVAPKYGLYTAAIAGFVIALTGGSRFSISGPTAAFVVILITHCQKIGAQLTLTNLQFQHLKTLTKANIKPIEGIFRLYPRLANALQPLTNSLHPITCFL